MAQSAKEVMSSVVTGSENQLKLFTNTFAIGASGAVDSTIAGYRVAPGCTLTNTGTGTFDMVYPICPNALVIPTLQSAGATVTEAILTAKSAGAGTASLRISKAGTATNPASGDIIQVVVVALPVGVTN